MIFGSKINDFQEVFLKKIRKTPQDKHKMLQDAPKTAQDAPKTSRRAPKMRPRRPKTAPKRRPRTSQERNIVGSKSDLQRNPLQSSIFERFGVDFGRVLGWFWGAIEIDFSWISRVISQVRKARLISRNWLAADPVVARVSREAA